MFNTGSQPTITISVVELADSGIESANSTADSAANSLKIELWVWAFSSTRQDTNWQNDTLL